MDMYVIIGTLVCLLVVALVAWYVWRGRRSSKPKDVAKVPKEEPPKVGEVPADCTRPEYDPRCTSIYTQLQKAVGSKIRSVDTAAREIARFVSAEGRAEVYVIDESPVGSGGNAVQALMYEKTYNISQEFIITIEDSVVRSIEAVDKMLEPTQTLAHNASDGQGDEFTKFISPLEVHT
jgi:hypothetical protein